MAGLQLSGLASGFDWKTLVDQLMNVERAPITRLQKEQSVNTQQSNALGELETKLGDLRTAAQNLQSETAFAGRNTSVSASGSTWSATADPAGATGSFTLQVLNLATKAQLRGALDITSGLAATGDVSGVTLATMRTATAVTAGTFSVNGHAVTVDKADTLQDLFDAIHSATGNDVTATYNSVTDRITLTSASNAEIVLGASNDSSNALQVLKLANTGAVGNVTSWGTLGTLRTGATLANAGLTTTPTAATGTFSINGVAISYNTASDTLTSLLKRINASSAGVTAAYDATADRVTLTNRNTGDLGLSVTDPNGMLAALGLVGGATTIRGENAQFTVNGGSTLYSTSNTLDASAHGIAGLAVTVDSETTATVEVAADTAGMRSRIEAFVSAYNAFNTLADQRTQISSVNGKVTASVLSGNREVQDWQRQLRHLSFGAITGLSGAISRLDDLGIDLNEAGELSIKKPEKQKPEKLTAALQDSPGDVEAFFTTKTTGFAAQFDTLISRLNTASDGMQSRLTKRNDSLDQQIADLERRLTQQRELMTAKFVAMEQAQAQIQQQGAALTNALGKTSTK
jgi:flagellar hook-associated protein 2